MKHRLRNILFLKRAKKFQPCSKYSTKSWTSKFIICSEQIIKNPIHVAYLLTYLSFQHIGFLLCGVGRFTASLQLWRLLARVSFFPISFMSSSTASIQDFSGLPLGWRPSTYQLLTTDRGSLLLFFEPGQTTAIPSHEPGQRSLSVRISLQPLKCSLGHVEISQR